MIAIMRDNSSSSNAAVDDDARRNVDDKKCAIEVGHLLSEQLIKPIVEEAQVYRPTRVGDAHAAHRVVVLVLAVRVEEL